MFRGKLAMLILAGLVLAGGGLMAHAMDDDDDAPAATSPAAVAPDKQAVVVQGEVLDMGCYMGGERCNLKHKGCALNCLRKGSPMGILDSKTGKAWFLVNDHKHEKAFSQAKELGGDIVKLTGVWVEQSGQKALAVQAVEMVQDNNN